MARYRRGMKGYLAFRIACAWLLLQVKLPILRFNIKKLLWTLVSFGKDVLIEGGELDGVVGVAGGLCLLVSLCDAATG